MQDIDIVNDGLDYDYIVVAIFSETIKNAIVLWLEERGVSENRIIWYKE